MGCALLSPSTTTSRRALAHLVNGDRIVYFILWAVKAQGWVTDVSSSNRVHWATGQKKESSVRWHLAVRSRRSFIAETKQKRLSPRRHPVKERADTNQLTSPKRSTHLRAFIKTIESFSKQASNLTLVLPPCASYSRMFNLT